MSWTFIGRTTSTNNIVTRTVLGSSLIVMHTMAYNTAAATCSVSDGSLTLANTPKSPSQDNSSLHRWICIAYIWNQSAGSKTYTATWGGSGVTIYSSFLEEYTFTGNQPTFDVDVAASAIAQPVPITIPSITPSTPGELLTASVFIAGSSSTPGGPWTSPGAFVLGNNDEYILSCASGPTAVNFADTLNPDTWVSMAAAFTDQAGSDVVSEQNQWQLNIS